MILGCGVDLIEVSRIERELTRRGRDPFDDLFTSGELAWCLERRRPSEGYALTFAAKEAIVKALGTGLVGHMAWTDMRIDWSGARPAVSLHRETATTARARGVEVVHLTATMLRSKGSRLKPASTNPGVTSPNPGVTSPNPGVTSPNPGVTSPNPGVTSPNPGVTSPNPGVTSPTVEGRHSWEPASAGSRTVGEVHAWEPASAGSRTGALAAAWVVLEGRSDGR